MPMLPSHFALFQNINGLTHFLAALVLLDFIKELWIDRLNHAQWKERRPDFLASLTSEEEYQKARSYHEAHRHLASQRAWPALLLSLFLLYSGVLGIYLDQLNNFGLSSYWQTALFGLSYLTLNSLLFLPFELKYHFDVEQKFGFNKMSKKIFWQDKIKVSLLTVILGGPLLWAFMQIVESYPQKFWLAGWIFFTALSLFLMTTYTSLFLPLFNKLSPLPEGPLKEAIKAFGQKVHFPLDKIMVMDGSKRSEKANAFFSGIGKTKNIVLFDTLVNKHTQDELVAILAHEVGHYHHKHSRIMLVLSSLNTLLTLWALNLVLVEFQDQFSMAWGATESHFALGLMSFSLLFSPLTHVTGFFFNALSRKNEFEADAYAREHASAQALAEALRKLSTKHLAQLDPHPLVVALSYSHPPLRDRLQALEGTTS